VDAEIKNRPVWDRTLARRKLWISMAIRRSRPTGLKAIEGLDDPFPVGRLALGKAGTAHSKRIDAVVGHRWRF
jgi:hypothetical protein